MNRIIDVNINPPVSTFYSDVVTGLMRSPKSLPPKYFYDERGSQLFDAICQLDEYYVTRTESGILQHCAREIDQQFHHGTTLIEYGSGSSLKTECLLGASHKIRTYVPIDISHKHMRHAADRLAARFPNLAITTVCADYTRLNGLPRLPHEQEDGPRVVFFPGSTIGNLEASEAHELLRATFELLAGQGDLIIGIDLVKDLDVLLAAYNDSQGVTAAFNLNLLMRMNRELGTNFALDTFAHRAIFNAERQRIEMHLVSQKEQTISLGHHRFTFAPGESIHTESSHKYTLASFCRFAARSGFRLVDAWTDDRCYFAELMLRTYH